MLVKSELLSKIKDYFDLNIYETKVWLALLGKGTASAGEIASISGVPRSRTYDVLESLEKKGFALIKLGKPVKYLGVKPKIIIEKLKNNVRNGAEEKIQVLTKVKDTEEFQQLEELYNVGINPVKREELSAALKGKSTITNHLKEIIDSAQSELIIFMSAKEMKSKEELFNQSFETLKKNNIQIKIALNGDAQLVSELSEKFKIDIKKMDIESKFFIVDRKEVLFYVSKDTGKNDQAIWLNSDFFSEAFANLFEIAMRR